MEHAEGNRKIVLKVLSTLLIMYILTGVALFVLAFLLYKMELTENIVTIGITVIYVVSGLLGGIIIGKRMKTRRFLWGLLWERVFPGVADRIGTAEPWADIGYAAYRADTGDVHGSRDDRGNGQLIL